MRLGSIDSVYYGETGGSCFARGKQHLEDLRSASGGVSKSNAFVKHRDMYHMGEEDDVVFKIDVVKCFKKPLERQIWEGVEIHSSTADIVMNSKQDHYGPAVGRMVVQYEP